jgi:hypothetical protein
MCVLMAVHDGRSAHGLLYLSAVRRCGGKLGVGLGWSSDQGADLGQVIGEAGRRSAASYAIPAARVPAPRRLRCIRTGRAPSAPLKAGRGSAGLVGDPEAFTSGPTDALPIPGPDAAADAARRLGEHPMKLNRLRTLGTLAAAGTLTGATLVLSAGQASAMPNYNFIQGCDNGGGRLGIGTHYIFDENDMQIDRQRVVYCNYGGGNVEWNDVDINGDPLE